jgi:hypothetical protein
MWFWITCVTVVLVGVLLTKAAGRRTHLRYRAHHAGGIGRGGYGGGAGDGGGGWGWGWGDGGGDGGFGDGDGG